MTIVVVFKISSRCNQNFSVRFPLILRSVHATSQLCCVAALHTHAMLLYCGVIFQAKFILTWNAVMLVVTCGRDVIDISAFALWCSMNEPLIHECGVEAIQIACMHKHLKCAKLLCKTSVSWLLAMSLNAINAILTQLAMNLFPLSTARELPPVHPPARGRDLNSIYIMPGLVGGKKQFEAVLAKSTSVPSSAAKTKTEVRQPLGLMGRSHTDLDRPRRWVY